MAEVSLTLKSGRDYDAAWLTGRGESFEELASVFNAGGMGVAFASGIHAIQEANTLADVKATLGATETPPAEEKPAHDTLPSANLLKAAAKKSGRAIEGDLDKLSKAEITAVIAGKEKE